MQRPAWRPTPLHLRAVRDGLALVGILWWVALFLVLGEPAVRTPFVDGLAYWSVNPDAPYGDASVGRTGSFLYSPVAAMAFSVIGLLPQPVFIGLWGLTIVALAAWMGRPWPWIFLILALPLSRELLIGQFNVIATAAIVLAFRWPRLWSIVLLTKVTPGVGLLWFAVRREWQKLAVALGLTAALVAVSYVLQPTWWSDWFALLGRDQGNAAHQYPLVRMVLGALVVIWGARTDRPWTVPLGAFLALPVIYFDSFTFLLGCVAVRHAWIRRAALGDDGPDDGASLPTRPARAGATQGA